MVNTTKGLELLTVHGATYEKCLEEIRAKYGDLYHLFSHGTVPCSGIRGFFGKEEIEVKFYLSNSFRNRNPNDISPVGAFSKQKDLSSIKLNDKQTTDNTIPLMEKESVIKPKQVDFETEKKKILADTQGRRLPNPELREVLEQVTALREEIASTKSKAEEHETIIKIQDLLDRNEFPASYIRKICDRLKRELTVEELDNFEETQQKVVEWIGESITVTTVNKNSDYLTKPHVMIVIGPTGVGKTTTVAKLAANFVMQSEILPKWRRVHIITIDRFRIAAEEQIQKYAQYIEVPVSVCERPEDIKQIVSTFREETDVFLIDTIGYSPKDYESIAKMRRILDVNGISTDVYLAVSASVKTTDLRDILKQYEIFDFNSVIVTKFDETNHIGNIISVLSERNKPAVFITNGQKVPRDIEMATIVRFLIQLTDFNIDRNRIDQLFTAEMGEKYGRSGI